MIRICLGESRSIYASATSGGDLSEDSNRCCEFTIHGGGGNITNSNITNSPFISIVSPLSTDSESFLADRNRSCQSCDRSCPSCDTWHSPHLRPHPTHRRDPA